MWGEQVTGALPAVLSSVGEVAALAVGVRGLPAAVRAPRSPALVRAPEPESTPHSAPVSTIPTLLVHGYLGSTLAWSPLIKELHRSGLGGIFALRYNSLTTPIEVVADQLVRAAHEVLERTGAERLHVVGHSLGGLVARYAVQHLCLSSVVLGAVTIATPHRGSAFAYAAVGPAGPQMRPNARLIAALPPLATTRTVRWLVVEGALDPVAPHVDHAGVPVVVLPTRGHQGILRERALADVLAEHLLACEPAAAVA
jgi:pimeloyl-ACP methyl ester carboxylesterase